MEEQIRSDLHQFILANFLFNDTSRAPHDDDALVDEGIIDSTGILELIEFLESRFDITVSESETIPQNLGSISSLTRFVASKLPALEPATSLSGRDRPSGERA